MQISSHSLSKAHEHHVLEQFDTVLADLTHPRDIENFLTALLTPTERLAIAKRLAIAWHLHQTKSYEDIKKTLNVSSATISHVAEHKDLPGFQLAIKSMTTDQWAEQIMAWFKRK